MCMCVSDAHTECEGGRQWMECGGGDQCVATCTNTMPMCPRDCYEGCYCPPDRPAWHHAHCITVDQCKGANERVDVRLFVLGACLCTMLAYSFFLQSCFVFLMFSRVFKTFLVGLATGRAVVFYE